MTDLDGLLKRKPPTPLEKFLSSPLSYLIQRAYTLLRKIAFNPTTDTKVHVAGSVRVVCISDTHNAHESLEPLPSGDILIHAGDLTQSGSENELNAALVWLANQPHQHKIFIGGNHDKCLVDPGVLSAVKNEWASRGLTYLEDTAVDVTVRGRLLTLYGSPWTPKHGSWVFQYPRSDSDTAKTRWNNIPPSVDILITHGPPKHHLDLTFGCKGLLTALWRVRPRLHVFGHIHAGYGVERVVWDEAQAAYESGMERTRPWTNLLILLRELLRKQIYSTLAIATETTLVNASALRGLRDEQRNSAIKVDICRIRVRPTTPCEDEEAQSIGLKAAPTLFPLAMLKLRRDILAKAI